MIEGEFKNNQIPPQYKKMLNTLDYIYLIIFPILIFGVGYVIQAKLIALIIITLIIEAGVTWAHFDGYRTHPVGIAYTEKGVYLKRRNGKIKFLSWDGIVGLRLGKNAAILTKFFPIYLFGEARDSALYYFEKYGVKKNPKLEKVLYNIRMKELMGD